MGVKVLLAAGAAVIINGLAVTLTEDTEISIDAAVTVDQAAEMCNLANLNVDLTHVDESGEEPVTVTYAAADASRQETPVTDDTPAPAEVPTADALVSGDATAPPAPEPVEVPAEAEPASAESGESSESGESGEPVADAPPPEFAPDPAEPVLEPIIETPTSGAVDNPNPPSEPQTGEPSPEQVFEGEVNAAEKKFEAAIEGESAQ